MGAVVDRLQSCRGHRAASVTVHMTSAGRVSTLERSHGSHLMERTIWEGVCVCEEGSAIGHSMCHSRTRNDPLATKLLCQRICRKGHCAISMCNSRGAKAIGGTWWTRRWYHGGHPNHLQGQAGPLFWTYLADYQWATGDDMMAIRMHWPAGMERILTAGLYPAISHYNRDKACH